MAYLQTSRNDRIKAGLAAIGLQLLLGFALIAGLRVEAPPVVRDGLKLFRIVPPPPPLRKAAPPPRRSHKPAGASSPPNLKAEPTDIVAPLPPHPQPVRPPVAVAPRAGAGLASSAGSAAVRGPGMGSGGEGSGTGSGAGGAGSGGGRGTPAVLLRGEVSDSDYPRAERKAGVEGSVTVRIAIGIDGRVTGCAVTRSSGNGDLDATTCRVIAKRYRYRPATDAAGRPVPSSDEEIHDWVIGDHDLPDDAG